MVYLFYLLNLNKLFKTFKYRNKHITVTTSTDQQLKEKKAHKWHCYFWINVPRKNQCGKVDAAILRVYYYAIFPWVQLGALPAHLTKKNTWYKYLSQKQVFIKHVPRDPFQQLWSSALAILAIASSSCYSASASHPFVLALRGISEPLGVSVSLLHPFAWIN